VPGPRALTAIRRAGEEPLAGVPSRSLLSRFWGAIPVAAIALLLVVRALVHTPQLANLAQGGVADPRDPPHTTVYEGSIHIARGGPVIFSFWSRSHGAGHLTLGHRETSGSGVQMRTYLPEGPTNIRAALPADGVLMWSPVGRRGPQEYVPASSLSPEPPATATFTHPGASPFDGAIALAILAIVVATVCVLARRRLAAVPRPLYVAMAAIFSLGLAVRCYDLGAEGETWDEDTNWAAGRNYVQNLLAADVAPEAWQWNYEHPPVMKVLDGVGAQFSDGFTPARFLSAIWIALGCALLVPIGARLYNARTGVLAGLIATLLPPMVAHGQIVGHESPTILWWSLGLLAALGVHDYLPPAPGRALRRLRFRLAIVGVIVGIAIDSRFVNGFLGPLCGLVVVVNAPREWRRDTLKNGAILMPLAAIATAYALWPRIWLHPIAKLKESFATLSNLHVPEVFLGTVTNKPGPHYFLVYLVATLPIGILALVLAGGTRMLRERNRRALILAAFLVAPLGAMISPVRQDGVRYVMPCLSALALIAAAGVDWLATLAKARHVFTGASAAVAVYLGITLARVHPYYLDFFSEPLGGAGGVADRRWFETAWWGEGLDRAIDYVNTHAAPGAVVSRQCVTPQHLTWFRYDLWKPMDGGSTGVEWFVAYEPDTAVCHIPPNAVPVFRVTGSGATFAVVYHVPSKP
jgi:4-amino-4-deoxy-L-arabinose transferase-like glycosyltransferase